MNGVIKLMWFKLCSLWRGWIHSFKHYSEQGFRPWRVHQLHSPYQYYQSSRICPIKTLQTSMMYEALNLRLIQSRTKKKSFLILHYLLVLAKFWFSINFSLAFLIILQLFCSYQYWYGWLQRFTCTMRTIQGIFLPPLTSSSGLVLHRAIWQGNLISEWLNSINIF